MVGPIDQFQRFVQTTAPVQVCVNGNVIVQILAVVDRGLLDFIDGLVDFREWPSSPGPSVPRRRDDVNERGRREDQTERPNTRDARVPVRVLRSCKP
jgi:hypothetical protein